MTSILYISKGNRSSCINYATGKKEEINVSVDALLNSFCLENLTTLKGRLDAIKQTFHIIKNVPIYISQDLVLFKTQNNKAFDNIYVNSVYVKSIKEKDKKIVITFFNNEILSFDGNLKKIEGNYKKCIKIKNQLNQHC